MAMMALRDAWSQRSTGERRVLGALAIMVVVIMVLALVWLPLERERTRLQEALPAQRASIATLEAQGREVPRLRAMPVASIATATPLASLATNAGGLPGASITVLDSRRVRVSGADVGFVSLLDWLRGAQITHGMRVDTAHLEALPVRGRVRVELMLAKD